MSCEIGCYQTGSMPIIVEIFKSGSCFLCALCRQLCLMLSFALPMSVGISRLIAFLLAMHVLNISIDTADPFHQQQKEDLSVNDIESIAELMLESVFDVTNAIAEHDEPEQEETSNFWSKKIHFSTVERVQLHVSLIEIGESTLLKTVFIERLHGRLTCRLHSPPPEG